MDRCCSHDRSYGRAYWKDWECTIVVPCKNGGLETYGFYICLIGVLVNLGVVCTINGLVYYIGCFWLFVHTWQPLTTRNSLMTLKVYSTRRRENLGLNHRCCLPYLVLYNKIDVIVFVVPWYFDSKLWHIKLLGLGSECRTLLCLQVSDTSIFWKISQFYAQNEESKCHTNVWVSDIGMCPRLQVSDMSILRPKWSV